MGKMKMYMDLIVFTWINQNGAEQEACVTNTISFKLLLIPRIFRLNDIPNNLIKEILRNKILTLIFLYICPKSREKYHKKMLKTNTKSIS